jgi:fructose-1,6-bisphosphatase I
MAHIVEQAGGMATDGRQRILDIVPTTIHGRHAIWLGSSDDVKLLHHLYKTDGKLPAAL